MNALVIGGGVSGMAAAHYLRRQGVRVTLIEAAPRLGGRLGLGTIEGRSVSFGGKNVGTRYAEFRRFCAELGVDDFEYFGISTARVRQQAIVTINSKRRLSALLDLFRHHKLRDLVRFILLALSVKRHPDRGYADADYFQRLSRRKGQPRLHQYFSGHFCREMIRPMVVRMNGAEPDEILLASLGSNLRVLLDSYDQLGSGMERLTAAFAERFHVVCSSRATELSVREGRVDGVVVCDADGREWTMSADIVVVALPAPQAAALVTKHATQAAAALRRVRYFPVKVIVAEYSRPIFATDFRALLFDEGEALSNAGAYGADDLATVRYTFSGRAARNLLATRVDDLYLLEHAESLLNAYVPVSAAERVRFGTRLFEPGLCAFSDDTPALRRALEEELELKGLYFTGDYCKGASIEACFVAARECAERAACREPLSASSAQPGETASESSFEPHTGADAALAERGQN
jgi:oxygen-dependent protoporphyrinogen oxidase